MNHSLYIKHLMKPLVKTTLADNLAQELKNYIEKQGYLAGQKLPSTAVIAKNFGVGLPTLREALKKLDAMGAIDVKHGSGIYVGEHINSLFLMNPMYSKKPSSKKQLLDLIEARIQFEVAAAGLAAQNATETQINTMESILNEAKNNLFKEEILNELNMSFHQEISSASGNSVFSQIIGVLSNFFQKEQLLLIDIFNSKDEDHQTHVQIFKAIKAGDKELAKLIMKKHLEAVREAIENWDFEKNVSLKIENVDSATP